MGLNRVANKTNFAVVRLQNAHLRTFVQLFSYVLRNALQAHATIDRLDLGHVTQFNILVDHVLLLEAQRFADQARLFAVACIRLVGQIKRNPYRYMELRIDFVGQDAID